MARKKGGGAGPVLVGVLGLVVAVLAGSWAWARFGGHLPVLPSWRDKAGRQRAQGDRVIRVQVLNGSGEAGIGTRVAAYLRAGGFHVVEVRNADRSDYFGSLVVARRTDLSLAREVSHYLGGPPLIQQAWDSELADVSVLIGSDRSRLRLDP
ncbi:MAG: LytR C-terminal domain-containing protein [Candidatus Eisenbacteria bacterium]